MSDDDKHKCPAPGCEVMCPRSILACRPHWFSIPSDIRARVNRTWRSGDIGDYLEAREDAVSFLEANAT